MGTRAHCAPRHAALCTSALLTPRAFLAFPRCNAPRTLTQPARPVTRPPKPAPAPASTPRPARRLARCHTRPPGTSSAQTPGGGATPLCTAPAPACTGVPPARRRRRRRRRRERCRRRLLLQSWPGMRPRARPPACRGRRPPRRGRTTARAARPAGPGKGARSSIVRTVASACHACQEPELRTWRAKESASDASDCWPPESAAKGRQVLCGKRTQMLTPWAKSRRASSVKLRYASPRSPARTTGRRSHRATCRRPVRSFPALECDNGTKSLTCQRAEHAREVVVDDLERRSHRVVALLHQPVARRRELLLPLRQRRQPRPHRLPQVPARVPVLLQDRGRRRAAHQALGALPRAYALPAVVLITEAPTKPTAHLDGGLVEQRALPLEPRLLALDPLPLAP